MLFPSALLAPIRCVALGEHAQRHASLAAVAVWAVGEEAAASEALTHQVRVGVVMNQMTGRCHLRSGRALGQIAARVGRCCIKLQGLERQILKMCHGECWVGMSSFQYIGWNSHTKAGRWRAA